MSEIKFLKEKIVSLEKSNLETQTIEQKQSPILTFAWMLYKLSRIEQET
jgi:hypothetical protein